MTSVAIALVGDPSNPGGPLDEYRDAPWDELPRVELELDDEESLESVIERAFAAFAVAPHEHGLPPRHITDFALDSPAGPVPLIALIDEDGDLVWDVHDLRLVTYGQLVRSVEAEAALGDPRRLYVVLREPVGNGLGVDWPTVLVGWDLVWSILERLSVVGGAAWAGSKAVQLVRARLGPGRDVLIRISRKWAQRGVWPVQFARFLDREQWSSQKLADLLQCSRDEADALLPLFGYSYDEGQEIWRNRGDAAARILGAALNEIEMATLDLSDTERQRFEGRVEALLRTGEPLPEPEYATDEAVEFLELVSVTITPEAISGHGRFGSREVMIQVPGYEIAAEADAFGDLIRLAYAWLEAELRRLGSDVSATGEIAEDQSSE